MLFLLQVTGALESDVVHDRVTVSPSNARVLCGFSRINTANMSYPEHSSKAAFASFNVKIIYYILIIL